MLHILVSFNESLPPAPVYYSVHVVRGVSGQGGLCPVGSVCRWVSVHRASLSRRGSLSWRLPRPLVRWMSGRYTSYWNTFLLNSAFTCLSCLPSVPNESYVIRLDRAGDVESDKGLCTRTYRSVINHRWPVWDNPLYMHRKSRIRRTIHYGTWGI